MGKVVKTVASIPGKSARLVPVIGKPLGNIIDKIHKPIGGLVSDTVFGKDVAATPNEIIDMASPEGRKLQEQLLGQYGQGIGKDVSGIAQQQVTAQENQIMQNAADQKMRAEQLVAQRGLGRTASGIGAILNQQKGINDQVSAVRSQLPGLQEQMRQQNLNFANSGINQILNEQGQSKILKTGQAAGKSGGLAPLVGAAAGAYFGGPAGAQAGMAAGQYAQTL